MKKLLLTLLTLMVSVAMNAERVSKQEALMKARQFMPGKQFGEAKAFSRSTKPNEGEPFYIFNAENNGGFVIVSGDSRMKTILGYSEHGSFDLEKAPSNVRWWLGQYEKAILSLNNTSPAPIVKRSATRGTSEAKEDIAPFITTYWGQHAPYNSQCPTYNNENCITGCIATAMAQVMNYTKWPESATSEIASYTTETLSLSVPKLSATTFNWDSMADDDIARLMRYCGQAVGMNYGLENSSAYDARIPGAMIGKFGYDKSMRIVYRNGYNSETWETMIYNELKAGRPVIYGGQSGDGGHSFICHGYQDGMFYINWGWDGWYDGYFALTALNPDGNGAYGREQTAVIGIQKPTGGAIVSNPMVTVTKVELTSDETASRASSSANFTNIAIKSTLQHAFMEDKTVHVGFALYLGKVLKQVLGYGDIAFSPGLNVTFSTTFSFGNGLSDGTYRIVPVYRESETSDWIADEGSTFRYVEATIEGTNLILKAMPDAAHDERLKYNIIRDDEVEVAASSEDIEGDIVIPEIIEIDGKLYKVTTIAENGFRNCKNMTSVKMPSGLREFKCKSFAYCSQIEEITIPKSLNLFYNNGDYGFFNGCDNLTNIKIEDGNTNFIVADGALLTSDGKGMIDYTPGLKVKEYVMPETVEWIANSVFSDNKNLEIIRLSSKLTSLACYAFNNCTSLKTVYLPENLTRIDLWAFSFSSIEEITLPSKLKVIEQVAFTNCENLKKISFPQSIVTIDDDAFSGCTGLESITIRKASPIVISENIFNGVKLVDGTWVNNYTYNNAVLYVPSGRSKYYKNAVGWSNFAHIEELDMPDVVISDNPFENIEENQMILGHYRGDECTAPNTNGFGGELPGKYQAAIGFFKESFVPFVGKTIKAVRFALTNTNIRNVTFWIGSSRNKHDLLVQEVNDIVTGWNTVILKDGYKIVTDSIFMGYEYESENENNYPIANTSSGAGQREPGCAYLYGPYGDNGEYQWEDLWDVTMAYARFCIQCLIEGDDIPLYDAHVINKELQEWSGPTRYFDSNKSTAFTTNMYIKDWGKYSIGNDFEMMAYVGETPIGDPGSSFRNPIQIDPLDQYPLNLTMPEGIPVGVYDLNVKMQSIKGRIPDYPLDDTASSKVKIYSKDMGRQKQLIQLYTSTWCPDALSGNAIAVKMRDENPDVVLVGLHSEDDLSCPAGTEYLRLSEFLGSYGHNQYCGSGHHGPFNMNFEELSKYPSFADIYISCEYNKASRDLHVVVKGSRNEEFVPLQGYANLFVLLTEDDVIAPQWDQSNGVWILDYKHQAVLRTNVSAIWGDPVVWNGDEYVMHYTIHLNDEWNKDKMHVVAYLAKPFNGSNFTDIDVVNCNDFDVKDATAIFVEDDVAYKKQDDNSAAISDNGNAKGVVIILATVTHEGIEYPVKSIGEEAFNGNKDLTLICIPESIEQIGKNAFAGCSNLKAIYSYNENPIALSSDKATVRTRANGEEKSASTVFDGVDKELCILYVPKNSSSKYRSAEGWGEFQNIVEMVSTISGDANNDGKVNSEDISAISDYITEGKTKAFLFMNANVNNDKKVDVADIVLLVNKIKPAQP